MAPMADSCSTPRPLGVLTRRAASTFHRSQERSASGSRRLEPDALSDAIYFVVPEVFGAFLR
jgi:hypothetical protein